MNWELNRKLQAAWEVLAEKENLETQIFVERREVHNCKLHLQMLENRMSTKVFNRKDRGLRLGRRFGIIAGLMLAITIALLIGMNDVGEIVIPLFFVFGGPPTLVSIFLLTAYFRGRKAHAAEAEKIKIEYEDYLNNTAKPKTEACGNRIAELQAKCDDILAESAGKLAFLAPEFRNADTVNYMMKKISSDGISDIRQLEMLCDKDKPDRKYKETLCKRKQELEADYRDPDGGSDDGGILGWMILDGILDSIFGR